MKLSLIAIFALLFSLNVFADASMATDGSIYRVASNQTDFNTADARALDMCKRDSGKECKITARFARGCWAVSKDRQLGKSAYAAGYPSQEEAKSAAMQRCAETGGINCVLTANQGCEGSISQNNTPPATTNQQSPSPVNSPICNQLRKQLQKLIDNDQPSFSKAINAAAAANDAERRRQIADEEHNNQQLILQYSQQISSQCGG